MVSDFLPKKADTIGFAAFGATGTGLTRGSQATTGKVLELVKKYPDAKVAFGVFTLSSGGTGIEEKLKKNLFPNAIFAGPVVSTIEEADKIRKAILDNCWFPRYIVVVTDEWHSRSCKWIWQMVWKDYLNVVILMVVVPSSETVGPENPMLPLRNQWSWALVNVLRHLFLVCVPNSMSIMRRMNIHQPTAKK